MSLRGTKRASGVRGEEAGASKRRRMEPEDALWQLRPVSDLKMSSIYNRSASEAPAELFRKDLISAMKLPDSEPLAGSEYWVITDTWKQDWERGVQVPVNPDSLPAPKVEIIKNILPPNFEEFVLPKDKYIHLTRDAHYQADRHHLSTSSAQAEAACSYDLDATDTAWLKLHNAERARAGASPVTEDQLEKVIEKLELKTWEKIQDILKSEEGLGIEYDENVICDVCRSPDSEDGNEMVFCDSCNICVHQACYGITVIPDGQWLCRPCNDSVRPTCVLCPNLGGAMKCTPSGHKWAHVSCVLWIPEVSIGCAEKMEPITKISSIPPSRWSLVCVLCRERTGACIQCSVKTCKTAYHVTCAFKHGLEMRAIIEDENADDGVKLRSYCQKHSVNSKKEKCPGSGSEEEEVKRKRRKDMTSEEKNQARSARLQEIEKEFDRHVTIKDISTHLLDIDQDAINYIYNYWKLKRRAGHNGPLLPPKSDDSELITHRQEQADLDKMKKFVQLRQDLERVRNLCYMVSRREKLSRSFFRMREQTFHKQVAVVSSEPTISGPELNAIIEANHGPSIYDRLYSHPNAPDHRNDFEELLARIAPPEPNDKKKKDRNGLVKTSKLSNPYKKLYVNGSRRSGSMYSGLSSEESAADRPHKYRGKAIGSSTDDDVKKAGTSPKKKATLKVKGKKSPKKAERKKKKAPQSKAIIESSSEDETVKSKSKQDRPQSNTLQQMEREMTAGKTGESGTDSDELMPIRSTRNSKFPMDIYSDSSEDTTSKTESKSELIKSNKTKNDKSRQESSPNGNDSQQQLPRTKAAMKEFIPSHPEKKSPDKTHKLAPKKRGRKPSNKDKVPVKSNESENDAKNKENITKSKQKDNPTDLIVPQRQAAKKASENMRSTTVPKKDELPTDKQTSSDENKSKPKILKPKEKEIQEKPSKIGRKRSAKDIEKEPISYVPQRQAAKKAAAHIKSGMGSKVPVPETLDSEKKRDTEKPESTKPYIKKDNKISKTPQKEESSSSSTNSSSSNYSSSSSSDEEEKPEIKPTAKAREIKPATRQPSMFSPQPIVRPTVDLPFLDKVSRPLSSTSASSDSDSSKASRDSGSSSPSPKRPRRRRKGKSISTDTSPRKAPDKKLKTSERVSECGISSPTAEGEESGRPSDARPAVCTRTRSITSSGNMPDAGQRKPSKDDASHSVGPNKNSKESSQSNKLSTPERKVHEEVKKEINDLITEATINVPKEINKACKKQNVGLDEKDQSLSTENLTKNSPKKSVETKLKNTPSRRMSVKDQPKDSSTSLGEVIDVIIKDKKLSKLDQGIQNQSNLNQNLSLTTRKSSSEKSVNFDSINPSRSDNFSDSEKHWLPKPPSPNVNLPPIEKPGEHEKYMTEDKSLDSDSADKSSIKMIARIQANLNENTMIKSPKTPMDARMSIDPIDTDSPLIRNITKRSLLDSEKKFMAQDVSHVQGVEISKRAKIPSAASQFTRSIFSPQHKDDFFSLDILNDDEGFHHDDGIKPFTDLLFKDDSKEKSVQETRNLVDRLRMQLNSKQVPTDKQESNLRSSDKEDLEEANNTSSVSNVELGAPSNTTTLEFDSKEINVNEDNTLLINHISRRVVSNDLGHRASDIVNQPLSMTSNDKWTDLPVHVETTSKDRTYEHTRPHEENKEHTSLQTDVQSEMGDNISLSKQSDDSQPLSVVDHSIHSNDQDFTRDTQTYDNNNSLIHSDCATTQSPYVSEDTKWRESKIATRRSSASSTNSDESVCSQKTDMKSHINSCDSHPSNMISDPYPPIPPYSCHQYPSYPPDASSFLSTIGTLPLFPPGACPTQLPLSSPAPGLFVPYSTKPLLPPMPKPTFPTLCAAFTSSSQNIALTTAMIAPPTPKPIDSPHDDIDVTGSDKFSIHVSSPSISVDSFNDSSNARPITKLSNDSNEAIPNLHVQEPKSPVKTSKPMSKFSGKSPAKSPAISPKQTEGTKSSKRPTNRSNRSQRGRGRSKSRGQGIHGYLPTDYMGNSIQSKLVGTVYDFDQEIANDGVDLKSLREKRKSVDLRDDRKSEHSYKEMSRSPHVASPQQSSKRTPVQTKEVSPVQSESKEQSTPSSNKSSSERGPGFSQVQPVLPGPVDMRTYHACENTAPVVASDGFHSHLLAFASGTADQHLAEIDEEVEKQLHSALMASKSRPSSPSAAPIVPAINEPPKETYIPQLPKVSLSDSRNQLKVKIKGPFLDANYSTSSVQPVPPQPPAPTHESNTSNVMGISSMASSSMMTGSTNLRRMRKKELLRQYWTQDMNMDDPSNNLTMGIAPPPAAPIPLARAVITIPKAVASMTSIPTREDYKISESPAEKKKRKTTSGLSRELRHLEVSMNDVDQSDDIKLPTYSANTNPTHKRRGRVTTKLNQAANTLAGAPKLKIKIGSNIVQQVNEEPSGYQFRPPKKRIMNIPKPSLADIRRENMKYRRKIMADFEDDEKPKKDKTNKSEKRKKKKEKKQEKEQLRVINRDSDNATKLIIKIKRTKDQDSESGASTSGLSKTGAMAAVAAVPEPPVDPFHYDPTATDPLAIDPPSYSAASAVMRKIRTAKVTPIRLKLSRSSQGSGYVMKETGEKCVATESPSTSASMPQSASSQPLPATIDKHSETR